MAGKKVTLTCVVVSFMLIVLTEGLNLGLIAGDNKRSGGPLVVKKFTHKSPVFINIHNKPLTLPPLPKLPKPSPVLSSLKLKSDLRKFHSPLLPKLPLVPSLPKLPKLPLIPKLPLLPKRIPPLIPKLPLIPPLIPKLPLIPPLIPKLPLIPPLIPRLPLLPLLPPILPRLPLLPIIPPPILPPPLLPILPRLKPLHLSSVKLPSLKSPLALGSEIQPVIVPCQGDKKDVLTKLRELRKQGALTTAEFTRFKTLLLRKKR